MMLNQHILSYLFSKKLGLMLLIFVMLGAANCGKRKVPLPPVERISQRAEISGIQRGYEVNLFWEMPEIINFDENFLKISRIDIYRLVEPSSAFLTLSEEEFASRSTLIATIPISESSPKKLNYTDNLEFLGQKTRLRYAIRFVNASGQKAVFSNFLLIEPTAAVAKSPTSLSGKILADSIHLKWDVPVSNVDGSTPPNILGYNIYEAIGDRSSARIINDTPIVNTNFDDYFFEYGQKYKYFIRTISLGNNGDPIESLNSNIIEVKPEDIFAPSAPSAISIAAAPNNLSLFFAVNPEKDIAGYRIYRSTNKNQPRPDWMLLTKELLTTNTFQDKSVESGKTYYYYLTAIDKTGNASEPSEIISETAP
jgi:hypothetical protein